MLDGPRVDVREWGMVKQLDIAPTILALMNLPVADNMVGTSLVSEQVSRVTSHDHLAPKQTAVPGTTNEERLKSLGYID